MLLSLQFVQESRLFHNKCDIGDLVWKDLIPDSCFVLLGTHQWYPSCDLVRRSFESICCWSTFPLFAGWSRSFGSMLLSTFPLLQDLVSNCKIKKSIFRPLDSDSFLYISSLVLWSMIRNPEFCRAPRWGFRTLRPCAMLRYDACNRKHHAWCVQ